MTESINSLQFQDPAIKSEIDRIYEYNRSKKGLAENGIAEVLAKDVEKAIYHEFIDAFYKTNELFKFIGMDVPKIEQFISAGVDFKKLESEYKQMESSGFYPIIVIAPSLALDKLTQAINGSAISQDKWYNAKNAEYSNWKHLLETKGIDLQIHDSISRIRTEEGGFESTTEDLLIQEREMITNNHDIHHLLIGYNESQPDKKMMWTVSLMPVTDDLTEPLQIKDMTISQYLTLQTAIFQNTGNFVTSDGKARLFGDFNSGPFSCTRPISGWYQDSKKMIISSFMDLSPNSDAGGIDKNEIVWG